MKKGKVLCMLVMSAVLLTGCVDAMPDLTREQSGMIAEYAASLLLKYSPNYNYKIVSEEEVAAAKAAEQELMESQTQEESDGGEEQMDSENQQQNAEETFVETGETESLDSVMYLSSVDADIAAELGINDVIIKYQSYEVCDSYPQNSSGFSVDAAQGKKLLIVQFDLQSSSDENVECNLFIPKEYFDGTQEDFFAKVEGMDADFEEIRKSAADKNEHLRFVASMDEGKVSMKL